VRSSRLTETQAPSTRTWWGKRFEDVSVYEAARQRTIDAFLNYDHVAVSFSGGKDSTAVLNVALEVATEMDRLPLSVFFYDEEAISFETERYVRRVANLPEVNLDWYCLPVRHRNACSNTEGFWWCWDPDHEDLWVRPLPPEAITTLDGFPMQPPEARPSIPSCTEALLFDYRKHGSVATLMGIRADESLIRRAAVSNKRETNWIIQKHPGFAKVYPIYDWSTEDVWTAPAVHGWDYNDSYDAMEMAGVSRDDQRLAPPFGEEPMRILWMWAHCFPDVWDRMTKRVPGAPAAARYSRSPLYNHRVRLTKPDGVSWPEWVRQRIDEHPPELRGPVAKAIATLIKRHYSRTTDPIVGYAIHPRTSVSWEKLYYIADKGDLKSRWSAFPRMKLDEDSLRQYREAYDAELATFTDGPTSSTGT
jgi:predicted phosphoadenosine phosphosulfate sulfurtransferase